MKNIILTAILFCAAVLFTSCEGFINAKETSSQISDSISYANAPFYTILVDDSEGNGVIKSPAGGETQKKVSDSFTINYDPDSAYEFLYWKIIDKNHNNQEYVNGEYFELETVTSSETKCTFVRAPAAGMKLCLVPELAERPQIISWSPKREPEGVNRDSRIEVMFDRPMALESIFYTKDDFDKLCAEKSLTISNFLPEGGTEFEEHKYYGYKTGNDDTIVFKNIEIVSNDSNKTNLLKYFEDPQFEDREHTSLAISVKKTNNTPNIPVNTNLLVSIDKNFYCCSGMYDKPVSLRESKKWPYWVNGNTDTAKPTARNFDIKIVRNQDPKIISTSSNSKTIMNNERLLKIKVDVEDFGSCPASSFDLDLYRITGDITDNNKIKTIPIYYERVQGAYASCGDNYYYALSSTDIPDGEDEYRFKIRFRDNSDNYASNEYGPYYIKVDTVPIEKNVTNFPTTELSCPEIAATDKTSINFKYQCSANDYNGGKLYYRPAKPTTDPDWKDWSDVTDYVNLSSDSTEQTTTISNLPYATTYELKAEFYDEAGNTTSYIFKKNTSPEPYSKTESAPVFNQKACCVKIPTPRKPVNADQTLITYKYTYISGNQIQVGPKEEVHNPDTDKIFYIRPPNNLFKFNISIDSKNNESISEEDYDNYNESYTNISRTVFDPLITPPGKILISSKTFDIDSNGQVSKSYKIYEYTKGTGVKITYRKYAGEELGEPITEYRSFESMPYDDSRYTLKVNLDSDSHYYCELQTYYEDTDGTIYESDSLFIEDDDFWTNITPSVSDFSVTNCNSGFLLSWDEPEGIFDYYIVQFEDYVHSITNDVKVPKGQTSYLYRNVQVNTSYYATILCYSHITGRSTNGNSKLVRFNFITEDILCTDISIKNKGFSSYSTEPTSYTYTISPSYSSYCWKYGNSYESINSYMSPNGLTISDSNIYYLQCNYTNNAGDKKYNSPIYAITKPYVKQINSKYYLYYLKNFNYSCYLFDSSASVSLQWTWASSSDNGNSSPSNSFYIQYSEAGENSWSSVSYSGSNNKITIPGLSKGKCYDIKFTSGTSSTSELYAVAFIKIPDQITNLSHSDISEDGVKLSWNSVSSCDCYNIYFYNLSIATEPVITITNVDKTVTSLYIDGLSSNTTYYYDVIPHIFGLKDEPRKNKNFRTRTSNYAPVVTSVNYSSSNGIVTFVEPASANDNYSYDVYYRVSNNNSWKLVSVNHSTSVPNSCELNGLQTGTQYELRVKTKIKISDNFWQYSSGEEITTFYTKPETPEFTNWNSSNYTITTNWKLPTGNYYKAILYISIGGDYIPVLMFKTTDSEQPTSYTFEDLVKGMNYQISLRFYNMDGIYSETIVQRRTSS